MHISVYGENLWNTPHGSVIRSRNIQAYKQLQIPPSVYV